MNPSLNLLFARRSVRRYAPGEIADATLRDLLEAAMAAPSACCKDPAEFIVVRDQARREALAAVLPNGQMLPQAPVAIVVCGDLQRAHSGELSYLLQDCSAAIENLLLAAHALGLGACWLGVHPRSERLTQLAAMFGLPSHIVPVAVIALGRPAETPAPRTRWRAEAVHQESW